MKFDLNSLGFVQEIASNRTFEVLKYQQFVRISTQEYTSNRTFEVLKLIKDLVETYEITL